MRPREKYHTNPFLLLAFVLFLTVSAGVVSQGQSLEEAYWKRVAAVADDSARGHYQLGIWCKRAGFRKRARKHLEKVLSLDPDHAGARRRLGFVRVQGKWLTARDRAEMDYRKKLAKLDASDVKGHVGLGTWCQRMDLLGTAATLFSKALALDPSSKAVKNKLAAVEKALLRRRVEAYIDAEDARRLELLSAIRMQDRIPPGGVRSWIKFIQEQLERKPRHRGQEISWTRHPEFSVKYRLLGRTGGKNLSLLVLLHGGGPSSQVNERSWDGFKRFKDTPFDLVAIPRVWDDSTGAGWVMESGPLAVITVIDEIRRAYDVDPDRIYLAGSSMGGYGTCWTGTLEADRFAALGIIAAGHARGGARMANLLHTPVTCHIGEKDYASDHIGSARQLKGRLIKHRSSNKKGYKFLYKEYRGMGHSLGNQAYRDAFAWMSSFKRNPAPRRIIWEPCTHKRYVTHKHYFYWLKMEKPKSGMRLEAEIQDDNQIMMTTHSVRAFTLFLNKDFIDAALPVTVVVNGREMFKGKVEPSLTALLESMVAKEDPSMVYTYRIDVNL